MRFAIWLLLLLPLSVVHADDSYRDLFGRGQYNEALQALEQSPDGQQKTSTYYFNRGVIHHALNQSGLAVAYLEKAKSMNVTDEELEDALDDARDALGKFIGTSRLDPASLLWEQWGEELPLSWIWMGTTALALVCIALFFFTSRMPLSVLAAFVTLALLTLGWDLWMGTHPGAMVLQPRIARSGPGDEFLDRGTVETGMKLRLTSLKPVQGWYRVRLNTSGDQGFLPETSVLLLGSGSTNP